MGIEAALVIDPQGATDAATLLRVHVHHLAVQPACADNT